MMSAFNALSCMLRPILTYYNAFSAIGLAIVIKAYKKFNVLFSIYQFFIVQKIIYYTFSKIESKFSSKLFIFANIRYLQTVFAFIEKNAISLKI